MRLIVKYIDGAEQETFSLASVEIRDGFLITARGRIPLERIKHAEVKS